jgi:competence protein ComEC
VATVCKTSRVPSVALLPALALLAGAACALVSDAHVHRVSLLLPIVCLTAGFAWSRRRSRETIAALTAGFGIAGFALALDAREHALHTSLRTALDDAYGRYAIETPAPGGEHEPVIVRAVLDEDGAITADDIVSLRASAKALLIAGAWRTVEGGVAIAVAGRASRDGVDQWRAGRAIEAPVTFRRPTTYLNDGVSDFERDLALDGTTLFASVKSGLLVTLRARGSVADESAAAIRHHVRAAVTRWVSPHGALAGAIVSAVLIGDRTGLPDEIRERLQAAGTYHVIAISGGNIAILAALMVMTLSVAFVRGRTAAVCSALGLIAYAEVVTAGPSVWRATMMAVVYLAARAIDHRTAPWQASAMAAALLVLWRPLEIRDAGFILTFGATAALIEVARRVTPLFTRDRQTDRGSSAFAAGYAATGSWSVVRTIGAWILASILASIATEIVLAPVSAARFSRVTMAGIVLNLVAIPMMTAVQIAGMVLVLGDRIRLLAAPAGWIAWAGATALVESARLVDAAPWLATRVPPPPPLVLAVYYVALVIAVYTRRIPRTIAVAAGALVLVAIATGSTTAVSIPDGRTLRWTTIDVGQGESMLLQWPRGGGWLVDAGGAPFGGSLDIGSRIVAPALWARGVRTLQTLLVTHGDPDHIGGAPAAIDIFAPTRFLTGISVPPHAPSRELLAHARTNGAAIDEVRLGNGLDVDGVRVRVLNPPPPDWERQRVRNNDSIVLEVLYRDVAILLTGDISADVERAVAPRLTPARVRIRKVAPHGSRTSTSQELLDAWRPHIAVISCGRGNSFGHPAPEVIERLQSLGARIYRTDLDGEVTLDTDGRDVHVRTFAEEQR